MWVLMVVYKRPSDELGSSSLSDPNQDEAVEMF